MAVSRFKEDVLAIYAQEIIWECVMLDEETAERLEEQLEDSAELQAALDREMDALAADSLTDELACFRLARKARRIVRAYAPVLDHNLWKLRVARGIQPREPRVRWHNHHSISDILGAQ